MARPDRPSPHRRLPYGLRFAALALLLVAVVTAVVLAVLPRRILLVPGLREGDHTFSTEPPSFEMPPRPGTIPRTDRDLAAAVRRGPAAAGGEGEGAAARDAGEGVVPAAGVAAGDDARRGADAAALPPTPLERLWAEVVPLQRRGRHARALALLEAHLREHGHEPGVARERAWTLVRLGRTEEAAGAYRELAERTGEPVWRLEAARVLAASGRTEAALDEYRAYLTFRPARDDVRLEMARLLYGDGRRTEAWLLAGTIAGRPGAAAEAVPEAARKAAPGAAPEAVPGAARKAAPEVAPEVAREVAPEVVREARALRERIAAEWGLPSSREVEEGLLARARQAAAAGEPERAVELYEVAATLPPRPAEAWTERAELLATRLGRPGEAADVLERWLARSSTPRPDLQVTLARYEVWAGREARARARLERLGSEGRLGAEELALLGDLRRWRGERDGAREAYREALAREPDLPAAGRGLAALRREALVAVEHRDPRSAGVTTTWFSDSDDFERLEVTGATTLGSSFTRVRVDAGFRHFQGPDLSGEVREETGPTMEARLIRWWGGGSVRSTLAVGAERLESTGVRPRLAADVELPAAGVVVGAALGPAHPVTLTFGSLAEETVADLVSASLYRAFGEDWDSWSRITVGSVRGGGVDNERFLAESALGRRLRAVRGAVPGLRVAYVTRALSYTSAAPAGPAGRAAYWDPELSWAHGLEIALEGRAGGDGRAGAEPSGRGAAPGAAPDAARGGAAGARTLGRPRVGTVERGLRYRISAQPGFTVLDLQETGGLDVDARWSVSGRLGWGRESALLEAGVDYLRGRTGGYEAISAVLDFRWSF